MNIHVSHSAPTFDGRPITTAENEERGEGELERGRETESVGEGENERKKVRET